MLDHVTTDYTIFCLPREILGISLSFLGVGCFEIVALVCNRFKTVYLTDVIDKKITSAESYTSSMRCAQKYLGEAGSDTHKRLQSSGAM